MPAIDDGVFERAISAAVRAPSVFNSQPWRFRLGGDSIIMRVDESRLLPVADPAGWAARLALGAAACNIQLALAVDGLASALRITSTATGLGLAVAATGTTRATPREEALYRAIGSRFSHRGPFGPQPVPVDSRARLTAAAVDARAWIELLDDRGRIAKIADILRAADETLHRNPEYDQELDRWVSAAESRGEGIAGPAAGLAPEGQDLLPMRDFKGKTRAPGRDFESDPLIAVLGTVGGEPYDDVIGGSALQRVLLTATADGLCSSMLSQAIEVPEARGDLRAALGHYGVPQMVIRFGFGEPVGPSPRRPVADVIDT